MKSTGDRCAPFLSSSLAFEYTIVCERDINLIMKKSELCVAREVVRPAYRDGCGKFTQASAA